MIDNDQITALAREYAEEATKAEEMADKAIKPVAEHFDNILKDSFSKERRLHIAAMMAQGIMANPYIVPDIHISEEELIESVADKSLKIADELIKEVEKGEKS